MDSERGEVELYRIEYEEESRVLVDWLFLTEEELESYTGDLSERCSYVKSRIGTRAEEEIYVEAYNNGYEVATMNNVDKTDNGITFRLDNVDENGIATTKMFKCGICGNIDDFTEASMHGSFFVSVSIYDQLWNVCSLCYLGKMLLEVPKQG